jgi:DnaK suppressor protein
MALDKSLLETIEKSLQNEQVRLEAEILQLRQEVLENTDTQEVLVSNHPAEVASGFSDSERDSAIVDALSQQLSEVEKALNRIKEGTYGYCEKCGAFIGEERLMAIPHASLCLTCKTKEESTRHH